MCILMRIFDHLALSKNTLIKNKLVLKQNTLRKEHSHNYKERISQIYVAMST